MLIWSLVRRCVNWTGHGLGWACSGECMVCAGLCCALHWLAWLWAVHCLCWLVLRSALAGVVMGCALAVLGMGLACHKLVYPWTFLGMGCDLAGLPMFLATYDLCWHGLGMVWTSMALSWAGNGPGCAVCGGHALG
jgi:hypothetical protein